LADVISGNATLTEGMGALREFAASVTSGATLGEALRVARALTMTTQGRATMLASFGPGVIAFALVVSGVATMSEALHVARSLAGNIEGHVSLTEAISFARSMAMSVTARALVQEQIAIARVFGLAVDARALLTLAQGLPPQPIPGLRASIAVRETYSAQIVVTQTYQSKLVVEPTFSSHIVGAMPTGKDGSFMTPSCDIAKQCAGPPIVGNELTLSLTLRTPSNTFPGTVFAFSVAPDGTRTVLTVTATVGAASALYVVTFVPSVDGPWFVVFSDSSSTANPPVGSTFVALTNPPILVRPLPYAS
jgi:hypothetical protein